MAHFISHSPPEWEFIRRESLKHKKFREATEKQHAEINRSRTKTDGLWWYDQRYVDQEAPFHLNQYILDPFNYRYQVYACPPSQSASVCSSEVTNKCPESYNVKRLAIDKVWNPGESMCTHHWSKTQWEMTCCPPIRCNQVDTDCNKNNSMRLIRPKSSLDHVDSQLHLPTQIQVSKTNEDVQCTNLDMYKYKNSSQNQGASNTGKYDSLDFCTANVDQCASNNLHKRECSSNDSAARNNYCNRAMSKDKKLVCDSTISPNTKLDQKCSQVISSYDLPSKRKNNTCRMEPNLAFASVRAIASYNKGQASKDTIAGLLNNQNNSSAASSRDFRETILVDNLIFKDMNAIEDYPKCSDSHSIKVSQCKYLITTSQEQEEFLNVIPRSVRVVCDYSLCSNNNAQCEYDDSDRPYCVPGHNRESFCLSETPYQEVFQNIKGKTYSNRSSCCMELLGHLQSHTRTQCFRGQPEDPEDIGISDSYMKELINIERPNLGYLTYKLIGGKQYRIPPPKDYVSKVKLPRYLDEYREFTRRCPNPVVGRYDRTDPAYEMLLPAHRPMNLMKAGRSPFMYTRNPKCYDFEPLFHEPRETGNICWSLPSAALSLP